MNIIFLDFDGVINSFHDRVGWSNEFSGLEYEAQEIDDKYVARLNQIIDATNSKVVVSSSWRKCPSGYGGYNKEDLQTIIEFKGFAGQIIDITPCFCGVCRKPAAGRYLEIQDWLDRHEVDNYVVLDDGWAESLSEQFGDNYILIEESRGIQEHHVKRAIEILS